MRGATDSGRVHAHELMRQGSSRPNKDHNHGAIKLHDSTHFIARNSLCQKRHPHPWHDLIERPHSDTSAELARTRINAPLGELRASKTRTPYLLRSAHDTLIRYMRHAPAYTPYRARLH